MEQVCRPRDGNSSKVEALQLPSYAGARSLLVSHWYVEDESTVNLMTGMFDNLSSTKNITSALRETKLKMIQDKKTEHPIFWAPFVLIGGST